MPTRAMAAEAGIFDEDEIALLSRVMDNTANAAETDDEREQRASRIIGYYQAGIRDEEELATLVGRPLGR